MADKEPLTEIAQQTTDQGAMENYFGWLQNSMPMLPWNNTNLNRIFLSNATKDVTATFAFFKT